MAEQLLNPEPKDKTPVWFKKPGCEARVFPAHAVKALLADKNKGWEVCEPEFVPAKQVKPKDEDKTATANKNSNTDLTGRQVAEYLDKTFTELKEIAEEKGVSTQGIRSKKGMLEKLEKEGQIF